MSFRSIAPVATLTAPVAFALGLSTTLFAPLHLLTIPGFPSQFACTVACVASVYCGGVCGWAHVRLSHAPLFPRTTYYGRRSISLEPVEAYRRSRRALVVSLVALACVPLAAFAAPIRAPSCLTAFALAAGAALEGVRNFRLLELPRSEAAELRLRESSVLFLRRFGEFSFGGLVAVSR